MNNILFTIYGCDVYGIDMMEIILIFIALIQLMRNRIASVVVIILLFFESFSFVGVNTSEFVIKHQYDDVGLLLLFLLVLVLLGRRARAVDTSLRTIKRGVIMFFVFFLISSSVDLMVNNVAVLSIIKVFRNWLCLGMLWFVKYLNTREVEKVLKGIVVISVVFSFLLSIEYLTETSFTGARRITMGESARASVPWIHTLLAYTLLLSNYFTRKGLIKWTGVAIILTNMLLSASRSYFVTYVVVTIVILFIVDKKISFKKMFYMTLALLAVVVVFTTDNKLNKRFNDAQEDVTSLKRENATVEGNFSFRVLLLAERMQYINTKTQYVIFGIGSVQESDLKQKLFRIGLRKRRGRSGGVTQIDTGDIAWAVLFLRFGYVGTAIYVFFIFVPAIWYFYRNIRGGPLSGFWIYLFVNLTMISTTYSYIASSFFWLVPIMMMRFVLPDRPIVNNSLTTQKS